MRASDRRQLAKASLLDTLASEADSWDLDSFKSTAEAVGYGCTADDVAKAAEQLADQLTTWAVRCGPHPDRRDET